MCFLVMLFFMYGTLLLATAVVGTVVDVITTPPAERVSMILMAVDAMKVGG